MTHGKHNQERKIIIREFIPNTDWHSYHDGKYYNRVNSKYSNLGHKFSSHPGKISIKKR